MEERKPKAKKGIWVKRRGKKGKEDSKNKCIPPYKSTTGWRGGGDDFRTRVKHVFLKEKKGD